MVSAFAGTKKGPPEKADATASETNPLRSGFGCLRSVAAATCIVSRKKKEPARSRTEEKPGYNPGASFQLRAVKGANPWHA
jgi:hypothetical protein